MRAFRLVTTLLISAMFFGACWGDIVSVYPKGGGLDTSSESDDTEGPEIVEPSFFPGGGTGDGAINGYMNLYFADEVSGLPVEGVRVLLQAQGIESLTGETDSDGLLLLSDDDLEGPVDIHFLADGYVPESALQINAVNATLLLRPKTGLPELETATVSGTVLNFEMMIPPEIDEYRIGRVYYDVMMDEMVTMRNLSFEPHRYVTEVFPDSVDNTFSMEIPATRGVLYTVAGKIKHMGTTDPSDDNYSWVLLGAEFSINPQPGDEISDIEISLNHNLSQMFILNTFYPSTFDTRAADLGLDFGELGTLWLEPQFFGNNIGISSPDIDLGLGTTLETGDVTLVTKGEQELDAGVEPDMFNTMPRVMKFETGFDSFAGYDTQAYTTGPILSAPVSPSWDGEFFSCLPIAASNFGTLVFEDPSSGEEYWRVTVFGAIPSELGLPDFPADWTWAGVPANILMRVWIASLSVDPNDMMFDDFGQVLEEVAFNNVLEAP